MSSRSSRTVLAHDTQVTLGRPILTGVSCFVTLGVSGAVHHHRMTRDLARFGRARGEMPFAFIPVATGTSTLAWIAGLLLWWGFVAGIVALSLAVSSGDYQPSNEDITVVASLAILLAPTWIVASHTMRRIRTARHLVGTEGRMPSPIVGAALAILLPAIGSWHAQRQLNRAWREAQK